MEQDRPARGAVVVEVWGEVRAKVGAEWAAHLPQGREVIVFARNVVKKCRTSSEHRVTNRVVPSAAR